jgi:hypothetical protein
MRSLPPCLFALAALAIAGPAGAQITFWDAPAFAGQTFTASQAIPNFADIGYNDRAASADIRAGTWQVCSDAYFRGRCVTLGAGQYPDLGVMGLGYAISSARELRGWPEAGGGGGRVVLYDGESFYGRALGSLRPVGGAGGGNGGWGSGSRVNEAYPYNAAPR